MSSPSSKTAAGDNGGSSSIWLSIRRNQILRHVLIASIACSLYYLKIYHDDTKEAEQQQQQHQSNNSNNVIHALSGSLGSALSITIFYPLETVRTRLQVGDPNVTPSRWSFSLVYNIYQQEGLNGLYRGWWSLLNDDDTSTYFQLLLYKLNGHKMMVDLIAGYLSGCVAVVVTGPLWLVNTRLKLQGVSSVDKGGNNSKIQYYGMFHCLYTIYKQEGLSTLWKGTFTSIILSLNPAIQLAAYEMLKRHHLIVRNGSRVVWWIVSTIIYYARGSTGSSQENDAVVNSTDGSVMEHFINALLSKFVATLITYPIQLIQTRQRWSKTPDNNTTNQSQTDGLVQLPYTT
eukprot:scaffold1480_cov106-Skeletonema_dohrnii-CCMP3373.AAC.7